MRVAWVKRGGGWVKCCSGVIPSSRSRSPSTRSRQRALLVVALGGVVVAALGVDAHEAVELDDLAGGAEDRILGGDVDRGLLETRRRHLAGDEAVPDQGVELELVLRG